MPWFPEDWGLWELQNVRDICSITCKMFWINVKGEEAKKKKWTAGMISMPGIEFPEAADT